MQNVITASALRNNIYRLLDQVVESGAPLIVERKGQRLKISGEPHGGKLARLVRRDCIRTDPEALVHLDWSQEWHHDAP